jgi:hypothetical protein
MIRLDLLPEDHPLRQASLESINAHWRWTGNQWQPQGDRVPKPVRRSPPCQPIPIATKCFNDLRNGWIEHYEWYCAETESLRDS